MPVIPLNNISPWTQIISAPGQTVFSTNWTADALTDVVVYSRPGGLEADDATQTVSPMNYTVAFIGSNAYVQVTFGAPYARNLGDIVTIMRNTPADRLNLYTNTNFNPTMLNGDFNREVMMIQQRVLCDNSLAVKYNNSETLNPNGITDNILPYLPPNCVWMKNPSNTAIIAALNGSGGGSTTQIIININQPGHGFSANEPVTFNGTIFVLAQANDAINAEVYGLVANVLDANNFSLLCGGEITTLTGQVGGTVLYLDDAVAGGLTTTVPTQEGHVSKPLILVTSATTGIFYNFRGKIIGAPPFNWLSVTADTQMVVNEGYVTTSGGVLNLTLPSAAEFGDEVEIRGYGSTGWKILQNAGQSIIYESVTTTVGTSGFLSSNVAADGVRLLCVVPNLVWSAEYGPGNLNYN